MADTPRWLNARGRGTRLEFAVVFGLAAVAVALHMHVQTTLWPQEGGRYAPIPFLLLILPPLAVGLLAATRRAHDIECSVEAVAIMIGYPLGGAYLISLKWPGVGGVLAGVIGVVTLAWLGLRPGTPWPSSFGAEPGHTEGVLPHLPVLSVLGPNEWARHETFVVSETADKVLWTIGKAHRLSSSLLMVDATGRAFSGAVRRRGRTLTYVVEPAPALPFDDLRERVIRDFQRPVSSSLREHGTTRWSAAHVGRGQAYLGAATDIPGLIQALDRAVEGA